MHEDMVIKYPQTENPMFSQTAFDYRSNLLAWGCVPKRLGNVLQVELINGVKLDMNDFAFIMSSPSGEIYNFHPWVKMLSADLSREVPEGLPNSMTIEVWSDDIEPILIEPSRVKVWDEWIQENYTKQEIDGFVYFLAHSGNNRGEALTGTQLNIINNLVYAEIVIDLPSLE